MSIQYNQMQAHPVKVKQVSNLSEYDESLNQVKNISIYDISCGRTHCAVTLDNPIIQNSVEYGRDLLLWGQNMEGQLNRVDGKRGSLAIPNWSKAIPYDEACGGRLQLAPEGIVTLGGGSKIRAEQSVACGPNITAVYTKICE